jgi:four helix bundle protein
MYVYSFEKLDVWQLARVFTSDIYRITKDFPKDEMFGLTSQIRRACVSVCSNIAEGVSRKSYKDKARFTQISYGSAVEVLNQIIISKDLNYISEETYINLRNKIEEITNKLNALHKTQLNKSTT